MKNKKAKLTFFILLFAAVCVICTPVSAQTIPEGNMAKLAFGSADRTFSQTIVFDPTGEVWYSYVPESTGYYEFNTDNAELSVYDSEGKETDRSWSGWFLEQGKTYCFRFLAQEEVASGAVVTIRPLIDFPYEDSIGLAKDASTSLILYNQEWAQEASWTSSDPSVANVDGAGTVTALAEGSAEISVSGTVITGDEFTATVTVRVTDPVLNQKNIALNLYTGETLTWGEAEGYYNCEGNTVQVQGVAGYSTVSVRVLNSSGAVTKNVFVQAYYEYYTGAYMLYIYPKRTGHYTIEVNADGRLLTCEAKFFKMYFKKNAKTVADGKSKTWLQSSSMIAMYPKETTVLTVKGASGSVKWTSSDKAVAKVDSKGKVTAKSAGYATITATCADGTISYRVGVADKTAVTALRKCYQLYGNIEYSQPKRMSAGYADCSSFVWKGYKAAGKIMGSSTYALTAAGLSDWCKSKGYRIFYGEANMDALLPGDLIFWCGANNGRSDGIYHVDLYQGNYTTLTVEREKQLWGTITNVIVARPCIRTTSGVKVTGAGSLKQTVSWKKLYGVTGYEIYRSDSAYGTYKKIAAVKGDSATSWTSGKLTKGKTYYYKIRPYWRANKKTYRAAFTAEGHAKVTK